MPATRRFERATAPQGAALRGPGLPAYGAWSRARGAGLAVFLAAATACPAAPDGATVAVASTQDGAFAVSARARVHAQRETVWRTLTDYDSFERFIPGLLKSRRLSCDAGRCTVDQRWRVGVLGIPLSVNATVMAVELPPSRLEVHLVEGNIKRIDGAYRIEESGGTTDLRWEGIIEGPGYLPAWLLKPGMTALATNQFEGMVAEIERRAAAGG
jgi:carbon monoxide dehydrogenase subunit G